MVRRITTNGMMMSYKSNLMRSYNNLAGVIEKVITHRQFNSYAENPSKASQAFQLRRTRWNVENQLSNNKQVRHKFQQAWDCMDDTYQDLGTKLVKYSSLRAENDADAGGRQALGEVIKGAADSVMQTMNAKYGENFIFSGADGQTVPFSWGADGKLLYRGMPVDVKTPTAADMATPGWEQNFPEYAKLYGTVQNEHTYVDLGMGMQEDKDGNLIDSSAFDTALSGIGTIGYGTSTVTVKDADGNDVDVEDVPNNIISIIREYGEILAQCSPEDGSYPVDAQKWPQGSETRCDALEKQLETKLNELHATWMSHDTKATFLKTNEDRLESMDDTLNEQITTIEDIDPAEAITALMWAQYSYNAALRIGTSILSQSLIDYMS